MVAENRRKVHRLEVMIFEAEKRHWRAVFNFRRCDVCFLLHSAASRGCDQRGEHLVQVWNRLRSHSSSELSIMPHVCYIAKAVITDALAQEIMDEGYETCGLEFPKEIYDTKAPGFYVR